MKKLIKKLLTMACCLVLCIVCLSGCSWLEIDQNRYYNQLVVTVGEKNFYKKDLIEAFSNYGYQYYQQYGYSLEESVNYTIGSMIDRWLLLESVKTDERFALTDREELELKQQVFEYMQDSVFTYEEQVREEWDMSVAVEETTEEETSLRVKEEEYHPSTYYEDGVVTRAEGHGHDHAEDVVILDESITKDSHFGKDRLIVIDQKVTNEAWARYVKALQDAAKSEGRSTNEADVLRFEEDRLYTLLSNNKYLEKYECDFYENLAIDTETVLKYFRAQYKAQKDRYSTDESAYHTAMQEASSKFTYYHPNSGNEYVNVKHILINFTEAQKAAITDLNTEYDVKDDGSEEDEAKKQNPNYKNRFNSIVNQTTTTFEMNGETYTWNALVSNPGEDNVYDYVRNYVTGVTVEDRCRQFNELIYIFNDDPGIMNSEFDYVVNLDTSVTDQMVKPFADGVRALDASNGGDGAGSMDYIVSSYGIHIIFHAGNAKSIVEENNIDNVSDEELLRLLCTTYTTPESNKSIFNYIYDTLNLEENSYNIKSQQDILTERTKLAQKDIVIQYYENNYKDLWS